MAHRAVADSNRQAPHPKASPRAVRLHPLGGCRLETRYIRFVISRQRVSAGRYGVPHLKSNSEARAGCHPNGARPQPELLRRRYSRERTRAVPTVWLPDSIPPRDEASLAALTVSGQT